MELKAIDFHVHPYESVASQGADDMAALSGYFGDSSPMSMDELADFYRSRQMMAVLLALDYSTAAGTRFLTNEDLSTAVDKHADVFIGFAGIDPWKGKVAIDEIKRARDLGLKGIKFNPGRQAFFANEARFYPIWTLAEELGMICLFHTGMMGAGAGAPGGLGYKLKYTAPIPYLDDIAADFPSLKIVSAHPGWPWQDEQLAMARHKANVFIDLSGWSPKYFPPLLVDQADSILRSKCLFGSDWPFVSPDRWLEDFDKLSLKPVTRQSILLDNAKRLLGI